jgi:hypothetical protein
MPASKAEQVRERIKVLLETVAGATVQRNSVLPEKIPNGGLITLRDGDPSEPEQALGGFGSTYYQHAVEIEVYLEEGDAAARDAAFDSLLQQIGVALEADPTLGGLAFGVTYGRAEPAIEAVFQEFTLRQVLLNAAKNGFGPFAAGISSRVGGPNTAGRAEMTACPAPEASPEPTISRQEHEAWDVVAGRTSRPAAHSTHLARPAASSPAT